jgi:hypothetical protein
MISYVVGVSLWTSHEVLIDTASDLEAADQHLATIAVKPTLLLQRDRNLKCLNKNKNIFKLQTS